MDKNHQVHSSDNRKLKSCRCRTGLRLRERAYTRETNRIISKGSAIFFQGYFRRSVNEEPLSRGTCVHNVETCVALLLLAVARLWVKWRLCIADCHPTTLKHLYVETVSYMVQSEWNKFVVMVLKAMVGFPTLEGAAQLAVIHGDDAQKSQLVTVNVFAYLFYFRSYLHYVYRRGVFTISEIVKEVCEALWDKLLNECIPQLREEKLMSVANGFQNKTLFRLCVGAVDAYGTDCDSTISKNSSPWKSIIDKNVPLPKPKPLPACGEKHIPFVFVGDEGFGIHHLMRPYTAKLRNQRKRIFNYRFSRAR
ncbi:hypothetical protein PR048_005692, partial [Dryococelus australis]